MINSDINKYTLDFMSTNWVITVFCVIALIIAVLFVGNKMPKNKKDLYGKILAFLMIGFFIINHSFLFLIDKWELIK